MTNQKPLLELPTNPELETEIKTENLTILIKKGLESNSLQEKELTLLALANELNIKIDIAEAIKNKFSKMTLSEKKIKRNLLSPDKFTLNNAKELNNLIAVFNQETGLTLDNNVNDLIDRVLDKPDPYFRIVSYITGLSMDDLDINKLNLTDLNYLTEVINSFLLDTGLNRLKNTFISITPSLIKG